MSAVVPPAPVVAFVDARHGWAAGRGGILATADGHTWRVQYSRPARGLVAVDDEHAWAVAPDGRLLRTTDGSAWRALATPQLAQLSFADASHGLALKRDGTVLATADGGASWKHAGVPRSQAVCAARGGRYAAVRGTVRSSAGGGRTWRVRTLVRGLVLPSLACAGSDVWLTFAEGAAAGTEGYEVFHSPDAGVRWRLVLASPLARKRVAQISNEAGPVAALGAGVAVFAGSCGACGRVQPTATIVRTTDGGRTFRRWTPFDGFWPVSISFVDADDGWLLTLPARSSDAVVWRTSDGGRSWWRALRSRRLWP